MQRLWDFQPLRSKSNSIEDTSETPSRPRRYCRLTDQQYLFSHLELPNIEQLSEGIARVTYENGDIYEG
jgi:hypothetical protein